MVRFTGAVTPGEVLVDGTVWKVRVPRLPKLPPRRASAVSIVATENTVSRLRKTARNRILPETNINKALLGLRRYMGGPCGNVRFRQPGMSDFA